MMAGHSSLTAVFMSSLTLIKFVCLWVLLSHLQGLLHIEIDERESSSYYYYFCLFFIISSLSLLPFQVVLLIALLQVEWSLVSSPLPYCFV